MKRDSNFELLRILAMCMIVTLHYLTKGLAIEGLAERGDFFNHICWLIYAFCMSATNVYVLVSGYFLAGRDMGAEGYAGRYIKSLIRFAVTVLFYSYVIVLLMGAFGAVDIMSLSAGDKLQIFVPLEYEHYWFATAYIGMYALSPVMAAAVQRLPKRVLASVIVVMLVFFSLVKSVNPYLIPWDRYGYDMYWFICLFLIGGYISRYGDEDLARIRHWGLWYAVFSVMVFAEEAVFSVVERKTGSLSYFCDMIYSYNHILVLLASISLFMFFRRLSFKSALINLIAPGTFAVYLIHEHICIRFNWYEWLGIGKVRDSFLAFPHLLMSVLIVFAFGILADVLRRGIFICFSRKKKTVEK
ncbi:MAG: acyltransferase [Lachnospiraceae bacterium]|nr:acyltransferase [Lachnospiraceae bacterium]